MSDEPGDASHNAGAAGGASLPPAYFDDVYAANADPWAFATSPYEAAKYTATLVALPRSRYRSGLEIGCSIGVLTRRLAGRCDHLLAVDVAAAALARARARTADLPNVTLARVRVPDEDPGGAYDLVVLSEVGYYWAPPDLDRAADLIARRLEPGGHLVLVHWTPFVPDYPMTGDAVHDRLLAHSGFRRVAGRREEKYRLDVLERAPGRDAGAEPSPA
ncbi:methyltransferase [Gemmatimonadetes bacterium T265]|nr:methyltransferase [Gemmatimonadetes bacterium T265]